MNENGGIERNRCGRPQTYLRKGSAAIRVAVSVGAVDSTVDSGRTRGSVVPGLVTVQHVAWHAAASRHSIHGPGVVTRAARPAADSIRWIEGGGAERAVKGTLRLPGQRHAGIEAGGSVRLPGGAGRAVVGRVVVEVAHIVGLLCHFSKAPRARGVLQRLPDKACAKGGLCLSREILPAGTADRSTDQASAG